MSTDSGAAAAAAPPNSKPEEQLTPEELEKREAKKKQREAEKAAKTAAYEKKMAARKAQEEEAKKKADAKKAAAAAAPASDGGAPAAADAKGRKQKKEGIRLAEAFVNTTPPGEKKNTSEPLAAAYNPPAVEAAWYDWWCKEGLFTADADTTKDKFVIVIPPPNVTGALHLGHALTNAVQDSLCRWHRMNGKEVLWVPGEDHAGIATQIVVERKLQREKNLSRHDLGREEFVKQVWLWKEEYAERIRSQLKRLGGSYDWTRERFTLDEPMSRAVIEAFVQLHERGLIYRDVRLVNWDCTLCSAISDIECDKRDIDAFSKVKVAGYAEPVELGVMEHFVYPVEGGGELMIATTRIETMLGDTAIAVHPDDERYKAFVGKNVVHPFSGRLIPIIADGELVKMGLGTGAVKVTPAHDHKDYECGRRNKLPMINIFTDNGHINHEGGEFAGLPRYAARRAVAAALEAKGLYRGKVANPYALDFSERSGDVIEPMLKPQWYVRCDTMGKRAADVVRDGALKLVPKEAEAEWFRWMDNIRDWCVSRQLWWGHRIPAYLVQRVGQPPADPADSKNWVVARCEADARVAACKAFGCQPDQIESLSQDPDVLDTWFSSGIFPFSVMGWPDASKDMAAFYPTSLLETGVDILFFWVARMVMQGLELTGKLPFDTVFLHAMVRDAHGRKMSKSKGNVIDPIHVIEGITLEALHQTLYGSNLAESEIAKAIEGQKLDFPKGITECGTDALRFALCRYTSQGNDINLNIDVVAVFRAFCNKIWNATRFALANLGPDFVPAPAELAAVPEHADVSTRWILSRLSAAVQAANSGMASFHLSEACAAIHDFWYDDLCDVYLEATKPVFRSDATDRTRKAAVAEVLFTCLDQGLRLLHPFMPFVTEELWQRLPTRASLLGSLRVNSICISPYPSSAQVAAWRDPALEEAMQLALRTLNGLRALRNQYNLPGAARPTCYIRVNSADAADADKLHGQLVQFAEMLAAVGAFASVSIVRAPAVPPAGCGVMVVTTTVDVHMQLSDMIDVDAELAKLRKAQETAQANIDDIKKKQAVPTYNKVPEKVRAEHSERLARISAEMERNAASIAEFVRISAAKAASQ